MFLPMPCLIALLLVLPVRMVPTEQAHMITAAERQALISLFEKTGGNAWKEKNGWLGPAGTECRWYGITCSDVVTRQADGQLTIKFSITDLKLPNNGLKGQLPPELGALKYLKTLDLEGNMIKSPLPDSVLCFFDQGQLQVGPKSLIHDVEEIFIEVKNQALLCYETRAWMSAAGQIRRERKLCREKKGKQTRDTYIESQQGKTIEFERLARSMVRNGFFSDSPPTAKLGLDITETTVLARRQDGSTKSRSWSYPLSMTEWELEMQIGGILASVEWIGKPITK